MSTPKASTIYSPEHLKNNQNKLLEKNSHWQQYYFLMLPKKNIVCPKVQNFKASQVEIKSSKSQWIQKTSSFSALSKWF